MGFFFIDFLLRNQPYFWIIVLMDYWINEFSFISGLWDRYKLLSHGPPSIESAIPNGSDKTSFKTNDISTFQTTDKTSHQVNKASFKTTDTSTFQTEKTSFQTTGISTSHVNNEMSSPENVDENTTNNVSSSNDVHFVIAPNVAVSDVSPVKNDNVLSRQQTMGKIQPYQVEC